MTHIKTVAICGAGGTMGAGIALVAARAGFETICFDRNSDGLARARGAAEIFLQESVVKGRMSQEEAAATLARLRNSTDTADLADCDLVIEAIFENLAAKQALFTELNGICKPETIFASNTSTLSITQIASGCGREDRVTGLHFCLPAQVMKLVELAPGLNTSAATFAAAWDWTAAAGQLPVKVQDKPGFILNALLVPFNNDVLRAIEAELATPEDIDRAITTALGYKMGPCKLLDLIGLDTQVLLGEAFYPVTLDPRAAVPPILRRLVAAGRLGKKSGRGLLSGQPHVRASAAPAHELVGADHAATADALVATASSLGAVRICLDGRHHADPAKTAVVIQLGQDCLEQHVDPAQDNRNVVGFARYTNGAEAPSRLIELVRLPETSPEALAAARAVFEVAGFEVAVCADRPGRIVDRLLRPKLNDALRFLDDGLASQEDLDQICCLGLGYPVGPLARVKMGGLAWHYAVTTAIGHASGLHGFHPARAAVVAAARVTAQALAQGQAA